MLDKRTNICIVANPTAGQAQAGALAEQARQAFAERGYNADVKLTERSGDGTRLAGDAVEGGYSVVVALGGDGTISEVANGIAKSHAMLGVIPGGTANALSRELQFPPDVNEAVDIIVNGRVEIIDLGCTSSGKYFVLMAGIGFDAAVVENVDLNLKQWLKDLAYPIAGFQTLSAYEIPNLSLEVDDVPYRGSFAIIGNARSYGGVFSVTTEAKIDDGFLDVCIFQGTDKVAFYKYLFGVLTHTHVSFSDVAYIKARHIRVSSDRRTLVQADGELIGELPMEFEVAPKALQVIVP